jgi:hypothetical protein
MYFRFVFRNLIFKPTQLLLLLAIISVQNSHAQQRIITGLLISDENAQVVQLASVLNQKTGAKAVSNRKGVFRIAASPGDTIRISSVGFNTLRLEASSLYQKNESDTILILMFSESYQLKDVTIVYSNRKRDSIAREVAKIVKDDPLLNNNDRILKRPRMSLEGGPVGGTLTGLITEMYYQFSKAGQDMVHFEQFVAYYRELQEVEKRYNREIAKRISGLDDYYMDEFMMHCRLDKEFVKTASDYDLYKAINDCSKNFKTKNGLD